MLAVRKIYLTKWRVLLYLVKDNKVASLCHQLAEWVQDLKNHKIDTSSSNTKAKYEITVYLQYLGCYKVSDASFTKLKTVYYCLIKLVTDF
jgi:hypothetical protein